MARMMQILFSSAFNPLLKDSIMCFSATASFSAGAVLMGAGIASISKVRGPSQFPFASIPIIFSIQQFFESGLWICLDHKITPDCSKIFSYLFIIIAQSFWPIWIPFSVLLIEKKPERKIILRVFFVLGVFLSISLLYFTIRYGASAKVVDHHITYFFNYSPKYTSQISTTYFLSTIFSFLASGHSKINVLGVLHLLGLILSLFFFRLSLFSVWCFFAALISVYIYFILRSFYEEKH